MFLGVPISKHISALPCFAYTFLPSGKLMFLGVPISKHISALPCFAYTCDKFIPRMSIQKVFQDF